MSSKEVNMAYFSCFCRIAPEKHAVSLVNHVDSLGVCCGRIIYRLDVLVPFNAACCQLGDRKSVLPGRNPDNLCLKVLYMQK